VTQPLVTLSNLVGGYGSVRVLHGVDLEVAPWGITALVGSNGAGKSTVLRTIAGLLPAWNGSISFEGESIADLPSHRRVEAGLVLVPEGRLIFPTLTVEENLRVGAFTPRARAGTRTALDRVYALFPRLVERRRQLGGTLSGGEQQMLAIGRALMAGPKLLLLDEPTLGLAPIMAQTIFETMISLSESGVAILLAEQNVHQTLALTGSAYVLENGRVVLRGRGPELLRRAEIREAYLGL